MSLVKTIGEKKVNLDFNKDFINLFNEKIKSKDVQFINQTLKDLHPSDVANLIENLPADTREKLIEIEAFNIEAEIFIEINESIQAEVLLLLSVESIAKILHKLESDNALQILEKLEENKKKKVLDKLLPKDRFLLEEGLSYPEDSAARIMQREFTAVPSNWTVGQTIDYLRENKELPKEFLEIFIIDNDFKPIGTVPSSRVLRAPRDSKMNSIMRKVPVLISANMDKEEVGHTFESYNLVSAGVVNKNNKLVGMITADDVVTVVQEEAEEDVLRLAGVGDEEITDSVVIKTKRRFNWLLLNLFTALIATWVISRFGATIEQMVALAFLMPIVASMGGNAGMQTLAVTIRAIAKKELSSGNFFTVVTKEFIIGVLNGIIFAIITGVIVQFWFKEINLSILIAVSMVLNMIVAGLFGILVPVSLKKFNIDPAIASSVFVTTITDVIGFLSFLGIGSYFLFN
ncbi:MAG: magnesium transporter [Pelagibacteraceae bacterium]|nr:magnesium transporter [Pelagibacteraceae bacterium]MBO6481658.1 magnesium transporter [Pelagibacteraceae bacterium]MBO6484561.1 magnesium transporter [Pelagibacteraceae bacterium]MBO6487253.1 magnesium transporter [Pelagibacteraceae bacterium]